MQSDEVDDNPLAAAPAHSDAAPSDSAEMSNAESPTLEAPTAVQEEQNKNCCICGLDVSHQQRSRDRSGRYWCAFCQDFNTTASKSPGMSQCPDCARDTRLSLMVEQAGERVCRSCNQNYLDDKKNRELHKLAVTTDPELQIHRLIQKMVKQIIGLAVLAVLLTLYHDGLLHVRPRPWVPFISVLYVMGVAAIGLIIAIGIQYIRIEIRKRVRQADYDKMVQGVVNHILALDEDSHTMGISESSEPLRKRVERAILRVEACAGKGNTAAGHMIDLIAKNGDTMPLTEFLLAQRPNTTDTVARNREIATISYLQVNLSIATSAITAILLRLPYDQDAMTRQALICFRNGELEQAKKIFKRVVYMAREKKSEFDLAAAYCNLGMLHVMLNELDDASVRYSQAMVIYNRLQKEDGQADCLVSLGLIGFKKKEKGPEVENQFRKAMAINKRLHRREGLAICCSLLGVILPEKEMPQLNEAKKLLNEAVRLNLELGRPGGVAAAYGNLGLVLVKQGDYPGATELFLKAQSIYQRINRPKMMAKIQGMLKTVGGISAARAAAGRSGK